MSFAVSLAWLTSTVLVILAAAALARRINPPAGSPRVADIVVIAWSWIALAAMGLSVPHRLSGVSLLLVVTLIAVGVLVSCARGSRRDAAGSARSPVERRTGRTMALKRLPTLGAALAAFMIIHVATLGIFRFPTDFDSLMYHIPLVDYWLQAGSLFAPASAHWSNPGANELLGLWAVAPFRGDHLISLMNIPAACLFTSGVSGLAEQLGFSRRMRSLTTLAATSNFVVVNQLIDAENDLAVAGLFLASLNYGLRHARRGRSADMILFAASFGLLCGVKYYALGYAALACGVTILLVSWRRGPSAAARLAGAGTIGFALLGSYWYLRNWSVSGSPLFPLELIKHPGSASVRMDYPEPWRTTFAGNGRPEVWPLALEALWKMTGPWHSLAVLALPTTLVWVLATGGRAIRRPGSGDLRLAIAVSLLGSGAVLCVTPMALEDVPGTLNHLRWSYTPARYGLVFLTMATLVLALVLNDFGGYFVARRSPRPAGALIRSLGGGVIGALAIYQIVSIEKGKIDWIAVCGAEIALLIIHAIIREFLNPPSVRKFLLAGSVGIAPIVAIVAMDYLATSWDSQYVQFYEGFYSTRVFRAIAAVNPPPERLSPFDPRCYPFFGPRRQFKICQAKPALNYQWLEEFARQWHISHIVAYSHQPTGTPDRDNFRPISLWLDSHPDDCHRIDRDEEFSLYALDGYQGLRGGGP